MRTRQIAFLGIAANVLFWPALLVFAALRPEYSHFTKAVSELGSWDAPNMWLWNGFGFIGPGVLLALFGWMLGRHVSPNGWAAAILLALAGVGLVVAGLSPADMSNFQSVSTIGHLVGSNGSVLGWGLGLATLALATRKTWPALAIISVAALLLMLAALSLYGESSFVTRAIVQRITFGVFFGWYLVAAILLLTRRSSVAVRPKSDA